LKLSFILALDSRSNDFVLCISNQCWQKLNCSMWIKAFIQDLKLIPANPPNAGTNQLWWVTLSNHLPIWLYLCWGSSCTKYSTCESSWYITYSIYLAYL